MACHRLWSSGHTFDGGSANMAKKKAEQSKDTPVNLEQKGHPEGQPSLNGTRFQSEHVDEELDELFREINTPPAKATIH